MQNQSAASLAATAAELGLPPLDQVGYVVKDLDRALETFAPLFGPFTFLDTALSGCLFRGRRADVTLRLAFGRSGPVEIELIEVVSGESPHSEFLTQHGEGVQHIRFIVPNLDAQRDALLARGFAVVWSHEMPELQARWAYLEGPALRGGMLLELYENPNL